MPLVVTTNGNVAGLSLTVATQFHIIVLIVNSKQVGNLVEQ
jgi:hypothetical protein